jgi:hypothetical protein
MVDVMTKVTVSADVTGDNLHTTQTLDCTKDKYNAKIKSERVSPKVSPTTYIG